MYQLWVHCPYYGLNVVYALQIIYSNRPNIRRQAYSCPVKTIPGISYFYGGVFIDNYCTFGSIICSISRVESNFLELLLSGFVIYEMFCNLCNMWCMKFAQHGNVYSCTIYVTMHHCNCCLDALCLRRFPLLLFDAKLEVSWQRRLWYVDVSLHLIIASCRIKLYQ